MDLQVGRKRTSLRARTRFRQDVWMVRGVSDRQEVEAQQWRYEGEHGSHLTGVGAWRLCAQCRAQQPVRVAGAEAWRWSLRSLWVVAVDGQGSE